MQERGYSKMVAASPNASRAGTAAPNAPAPATARTQLTTNLASTSGSAGGRYALTYYRSATDELHTTALADEYSQKGGKNGARQYARFKRSLDTSQARIAQRCGQELKRCLIRREFFLENKTAALTKLAGSERLGQKKSGWQPTSKLLHNIGAKV